VGDAESRIWAFFLPVQNSFSFPVQPARRVHTRWL